MTPSQIPNAITVARMVVAFPLLWLLLENRFPEALWVALVAGASDAVDGYLAKRYSWQSVLGGILDPIADKLLLTVCFLGLWWGGHLPAWLFAVVLARDVVIGMGTLAWWRVNGSIKPAPTGISKLTTLVQLLLVAMVMAHLAGLDIPPAWVQPLMLVCAGVTVVSGIDYVMVYSLRAVRARRGKR
jgi:cardiolipin synthase (CMP-forming)